MPSKKINPMLLKIRINHKKEKLMIEQNIERFKSKVKALEALRTQCNDTEISVVGYQDNDKLIKVLNEEYPKIFSSLQNQIINLIDGKKPLTKVNNATKVLLEDELIGQCFLLHIKPLYKNGRLLPFNKLSAKITKEINLLKKKIEQDSILSLFEKK